MGENTLGFKFLDQQWKVNKIGNQWWITHERIPRETQGNPGYSQIIAILNASPEGKKNSNIISVYFIWKWEKK